MVMLTRSAHPHDLGELERLLQGAGLTIAGVREHLDGFEVAEEGGRIVATAGLEVYGSAALLRSVAVNGSYRRRGIARELVRRRLDHAAADGVGEVYLLTTTAADYFRRLGFEAIGRNDVAEAVRVSAEFADARCETAQAMRMTIEPVRAAQS